MLIEIQGVWAKCQHLCFLTQCNQSSETQTGWYEQLQRWTTGTLYSEKYSDMFLSTKTCVCPPEKTHAQVRKKPLLSVRLSVSLPYSEWISLAFLQLTDSYLEVIIECMNFKENNQLLHRPLYSVQVWKIMKILRGIF